MVQSYHIDPGTQEKEEHRAGESRAQASLQEDALTMT
jgi:hypothetical protein